MFLCLIKVGMIPFSWGEALQIPTLRQTVELISLSNLQSIFEVFSIIFFLPLISPSTLDTTLLMISLRNGGTC